MSKTKQLLKSMAAKEKAIKEALDNASPGDFSEEGKKEMIQEVENMIAKLESWKDSLQEDIATKKAS